MQQLLRAIHLETGFQVWRSIRRKHAANWRAYPGNARVDRQAFLTTDMGRYR